MKNMIFWWLAFFALIIVLSLLAMQAFGQGAPAPGGGQAIEMAPLINFDDMWEPLYQWFTDILKEYWVLLLSVFFVWFALMSALSFLSGRMERRAAIERQRVLVRDRRAALEFEQESQREDYRRQLRAYP